MSNKINFCVSKGHLLRTIRELNMKNLIYDEDVKNYSKHRRYNMGIQCGGNIFVNLFEIKRYCDSSKKRIMNIIFNTINHEYIHKVIGDELGWYHKYSEEHIVRLMNGEKDE